MEGLKRQIMNLDDAWRKQFIAGEMTAFEVCYQAYSRQLYTIIKKICGCEQSAKELLHDVFVVLLLSGADYLAFERFG